MSITGDDRIASNDVPDDDDRFARALQQEHEQLISPEDATSSLDDLDQEISGRVRPLMPVLELLEAFKTNENSRGMNGGESSVALSDESTDHWKEESDGEASWNPLANQTCIGRFRIVSQIGRGGYGIVLRGVDPELDRDVAIKLPKLDTALSSESRQRFRQEAKAAAALNHPGIVAVHETGSDGGIDYIVTEFIQGPNLASVLSQGKRLSPRSAANLIQQLAAAVSHAHHRGVIHRDIKPSNILIASEQPLVAKITDFGLAAMADQVNLTQSGDLIGTPAYMSPEQATGRTAEIGPPTDVYGLGAVMYQCLTGSPPFTGATIIETVRAIHEELPDPIRSHHPNCPRDLESICLKCLEKDPRRRYASADELAEDLSRFLGGQSVVARPIRPYVHWVRWCQRNPVTSMLWAAVLLLVVTLATGSTISAMVLADAQRKTLDSLEREILAKDRATQSEEDAIAVLYEARMALATARRVSGKPGQRFESLQAIRDAGKLSERLLHGEAEKLRRRNEAIGAMAIVDLQIDRRWPGVPPQSASVKVGVDHQAARYARLEADGDVVVRDMETNRELARVSGLGSLADRPKARFSHGGKWLLVSGLESSSVRRAQLWDLTNPAEPVWDEPVLLQARTPFDFSGDDRTLALISIDGSIHLVDLETMQVANELSMEDPASWVKFSPSGKRMAIASVRQRSIVRILDAMNGEFIGEPLVHSHGVNDGSFSVDGSMLATACDDFLVHVWDTTTMKELSVGRGHQSAVNAIDFAHNTPLLMSTGLDMSTRLWEPSTGRQLLKAHGRADRFSQDDRWLGMSYAGVNVGRWKVAGGNEFFGLPGANSPAFAYDMQFSPDGRLLAVAGLTEGTSVWDMQTRREVIHVKDASSSVSFHTNGTELIAGGRGNGLRIWPIEQPSANHWRLGTVRSLPDTNYPKTNVSVTAQHDTAVINVNWDTAIVVDVKSGIERHRIRATDNRFHDISPDGKWIAAGSWRGSGVKIWDAETGEMIYQLPIEGMARVAFASNGRWLVTCTPDDYTFWEVGSWQRRHGESLPNFIYRRAAFSEDGRLAAITMLGGFKLIESVSGNELASFYSPEDFSARSLAISPNGRQIAVGAQEGPIYVWQVDRIRDNLAEMGLDWDDPGTEK